MDRRVSGTSRATPKSVIPAKAGIQGRRNRARASVLATPDRFSGPVVSGLPEAAVRLRRADEPPDGGCFRKRGLVAHLAGMAGDRFELLELPASGAMAGLAELLRFCRRTRARSVLLFYPETPGFLPPRAMKVPWMAMMLGAAAWVLRGRGRRLVLDVEDLPGPQHRELRGAPHPAGEGTLRVAEEILARLADEVWIPTVSMAELWRSRLACVPGRMRVVPTGWTGDAPAKAHGRGRGIDYFYAGDLDAGSARGVLRMIECFRARGRRQDRLMLAGPRGEWIAASRGGGRIEWLGELEPEECRRAGALCDVGLVPYPERGYFHRVFPAKLALYASCGLTVLSTRLLETSRALEKARVGLSVRWEEWGEVLETGAAGRLSPRPGPWSWREVLDDAGQATCATWA